MYNSTGFSRLFVILLIQIETVCAKNTELANILRSPWVFTIHEARLMTLHRPLYCNPYANLLEVTLPHCSYLDIYISRKIRLCIVDLEGKCQTKLQAKLLNFLVWKFRSIILIFLLFFCRICQIQCFLHTVVAMLLCWHVWIMIFASNVRTENENSPFLELKLSLICSVGIFL